MKFIEYTACILRQAKQSNPTSLTSQYDSFLIMFFLLLLVHLMSSSLADSSCMTLQETTTLLAEQEVKMQMDMEAWLDALEVKLEEKKAKLAASGLSDGA